MALRPVHGSAFLDEPSTRLCEAIVEDLADGCSAVGVLDLLHEQLESRKDLGQLVQKRRQAEALDAHQDVGIFTLL